MKGQPRPTIDFFEPGRWYAFQLDHPGGLVRIDRVKSVCDNVVDCDYLTYRDGKCSDHTFSYWIDSEGYLMSEAYFYPVIVRPATLEEVERVYNTDIINLIAQLEQLKTDKARDIARF